MGILRGENFRQMTVTLTNTWPMFLHGKFSLKYHFALKKE